MAGKESKARPKRRKRRVRISADTLLRLHTQAGSTIETRTDEHDADAAGRRLALVAGESLRYASLSILALAERRITEPELVQLERLVDQETEPKRVRESLDFLGKFWGVVTRATLNPVLERHVCRKSRRAMELGRSHGIGLESNDRILSRAPYRALIQALRRGYGAPAFWAEQLEAFAVMEIRAAPVE